MPRRPSQPSAASRALPLVVSHASEAFSDPSAAVPLALYLADSHCISSFVGGLNVTSTVVKDTTMRDIRRGEEGNAGRGESEQKERECRDTQPNLQLLAWLSVQSHPTWPSQKRQTRTPSAAAFTAFYILDSSSSAFSLRVLHKESVLLM